MGGNSLAQHCLAMPPKMGLYCSQIFLRKFKLWGGGGGGGGGTGKC